MFLRPLLATAALGAVLTTALSPMTASAQADAMAPPAAAAAMSPNLVANGSIYATLKASSHFTVLTKALEAAQLDKVLSATPNLTLFAPTDDAFNALPPAQLAKLLLPDNAQILQKVLIYHLVNAPLDGAKIKGSKGQVASVETGKLQLDGSGDVLKVNDAAIIQADVKATNGTIHVVDKVLIPTDVALPSASASAATAATPAG